MQTRPDPHGYGVVALPVQEGEHEGRGHPGDLVFHILPGGLDLGALLAEQQGKARLVHDPNGDVDADFDGAAVPI